MALGNANTNYKDIEVLEEQLLQLQRSYIDLTQKYAKISAELVLQQDNFDDIKRLVKKPQVQESSPARKEAQRSKRRCISEFFQC
ncbi:18212_t:CDS:2 [Dentiscutata erythropus]|uniref:18212_t:CDS:1 n=1 Tax=Dentiscutata erythropus TaxID=1348616 RepID=A0A9N9CAB0_9GLOM|nr:18212_t:CDS:2 [Dentiscutata erythropus]